jgi:quinol monooxygenase YgiN/mannose-6-phosphate isomerase-like protein (cupin superfamily)
MTQIGRYAKLTAKAGHGDALTGYLLEAARQLDGTPGCELYIVNRDAGNPDVVWVTEIWRSQADLDASLELEGARERIAEVMPLLDGRPEVIDTTPVAGVGYVDASNGVAPYTVVSLPAVEDMAAKHGFGEMGEARFPNVPLATRATGLSLQRLRPGKRQQFGHRHERAEEVYVVTEGSGRVKLDDDIVELSRFDAVRVAPGVARAFEAGPDGLEVLAFGPRHPGDGEILRDWWPR